MQQRMLHEEALQAEMEERMLIEERRRTQADRLICRMEEQEEIAIERLRRTQVCSDVILVELDLTLTSNVLTLICTFPVPQDAQKAAYEELERALSNPPPPISQRQAAIGYPSHPDQ